MQDMLTMLILLTLVKMSIQDRLLKTLMTKKLVKTLIHQRLNKMLMHLMILERLLMMKNFSGRHFFLEQTGEQVAESFFL